MRDVYVVGVHTIKFGRHPEEGIKELTGQTLRGVLADASLERGDVQSAWFSNSGWGMSGFQHCIRGQVALRPHGVDSIPITNVENACAGGSTAFHGAWKDVASGAFDVSLAIGAEKLFSPNKYAIFAGFIGGLDAGDLLGTMRMGMERTKNSPKAPPATKSGPRRGKKPRKSLVARARELRDGLAVGVILGESLGYKALVDVAREGAKAARSGGGGNKGDHSPFMDVYAAAARMHMERYGSTQRQLAVIASKAHYHSSLNPNAQYTFEVSVDEALADRGVAFPLTRAMCAPIGDGAASAILMSETEVKKRGLSDRAVRVRASLLGSGRARGPEDEDIAERLSKLVYERAGIGPQDVDVAEVHDATAFGELHQTEALGFFPHGEGGVHAERGETRIGGSIPINPSGGLISRGHPIGASGLAQIHELVTQLRHGAGKRQVEGARLALAENGGGALGEEEAAMCLHVFERTAS